MSWSRPPWISCNINCAPATSRSSPGSLPTCPKPWWTPIRSSRSSSTSSITPARPSNAAARLMAFDGLAGVIDDVEEDLLGLMGVHHGFGQVGSEPGDDLDVAGAQLILQEIHGGLDQLIDVGELALRLVAAGEAEEALDNFLAA